MLYLSIIIEKHTFTSTAAAYISLQHPYGPPPNAALLSECVRDKI